MLFYFIIFSLYSFKYCIYIFIYLLIHPIIATFSDHNVAASQKRLTGPKKHARLHVPETRFAPSPKDESRFGVTAKRVAARRAD